MDSRKGLMYAVDEDGTKRLVGAVTYFHIEVSKNVHDPQELADQVRAHEARQATVITGGGPTHLKRLSDQTSFLRELVEPGDLYRPTTLDTHPDTLNFLQKQRQRQERKAGKR